MRLNLQKTNTNKTHFQLNRLKVLHIAQLNGGLRSLGSSVPPGVWFRSAKPHKRQLNQLRGVHCCAHLNGTSS